MDSTSVVLIHPSRLLSEALGSILSNAPFKLSYVATDIDSVPFEMPDEDTLFIVGGRTAAHISNLVSTIRQRFSSSIIVAIGDTNEPEAVMMALEAGANAFLREAMTSQTLIMALELASNDEIILPPEAAQYLPGYSAPPNEVILKESQENLGPEIGGEELHVFPQDGISLPGFHLSPRETAILQALIDGASNKVIAQDLHITEATVKVHVKAVLRKIRVKNRTQAAVWAVKNPSVAYGYKKSE